MDNLIMNHLRDRLKFIQTEVTPDIYNLLIEEVMQFSQEAVNGCAAALEEFYTKIKGNEQYNLGYEEGYEQREAELQSERFDDEQYGWERGYRDGYEDKQHGNESAI